MIETPDQYDKTQEPFKDKASVDEHEESVRSKTYPEDDEDIEYPDGGLRAWSVVAGVCFASFHSIC